MAKFDMFDKSTWEIEQTDYEKALANKAVGTIGQKIGELSRLKEKLLKGVSSSGREDYNFAEALKQRNLTAYNLMKISYEFPDAKIDEAINTIDKILLSWKEVSARNSNWQKLIPLFEVIKPYLNDSSYNYNQDNLKKLTTIKVTGNAAWDVYCLLAKQNAALIKEINKYSESDDDDDVDRIDLDRDID